MIWNPPYCGGGSAGARTMETMQEKEDAVAKALECDDKEYRLLLWKHLRLAHPHQSSNLAEIERDLAAARKKEKT